jgi:hypothetical protein
VASGISNGTSSVSVVNSGGNIATSVGGTSNVVVWATTGEYVTGLISASGNITSGNLLTGGLISATANVTGGNILTAGVVKTTAKTFATLPAAANIGAGARSFITDANTATFGSQVTSGGANAVPVWTNGTNWYVG